MNRSLWRSFSTQVLPVAWPTNDFSGKTIIVTGANTGIGKAAVWHFARLNAQKVILGCRDLAKAETAKKEIEATLGDKTPACELEVWQVDLGSFDSVKAFCRSASELERLDVVIENAGLLSHVHEQFEGYERQCTVNVISTWLMAFSLLPTLRRTGQRFFVEGNQSDMPHLCIVGSNAQFYTDFQHRNEPSIFEALRSGDDMYHRYANTKLMSLMVMREVAAKMQAGGDETVILNMVEPGFAKSDLLREGTWQWYFKLMMAVSNAVLARSCEMAARNYAWAASAGPRSHGRFIEDCMLSTPAPFADTEEGLSLQRKVFGELLEILEGIQPDVTGCI